MPNKLLGQHFLKNNKILRILADSLGDIHNEIVIEIGGGTGNLTKFLLNAKKLLVYEIDKKLSGFLKKKFSNYKNIFIFNKDFLSANLKKFNHNFLIIGNIPYFITGKILRKIFNVNNYPKLAVLTLQKEYGEKILGNNGSNLLFCFIRNLAEAKKITIIKSKHFFPSPRVDSMAIKFLFHPQPLIPEIYKFEKFLNKIFHFNKKTIMNNLKEFYPNKIIYFDDKNLLFKRPHQLTFNDIYNIFYKIENEKNN
ncbi:MAG: ribosomal RNA small subunit methyltransferase A [Candidatus Parcubacteria bacterium]|nr:MAG: ribosomal RNA small subunit methyltransferase A [Candidatus Parcubacteria bacterium]